MPDWHSTLHIGCLWCWIKHKCITNMTVVCAQILLYLFGAHQSASSQIAMDTERTVHTTSVCYIWWVLVSFSGMVAALTNERTRSKSIYFAHCRDGNVFADRVAERSTESSLVSYVCMDLIVYSETSFENRDDLSSSNLVGVSRSTTTPENNSTASSQKMWISTN